MKRVFMLCVDGNGNLAIIHVLKDKIEEYLNNIDQINFKDRIPEQWGENDVVLIEGRVVTPKHKTIWSFE